MQQLILASTSPARRALLDTLGLPYRCEAPNVGESIAPGTSVEDAVVELAQRKARAVHGRYPHAWVLGADQLVSLDDRILGKPPDREAAHAQLQSLSGRSHRIVTGVSLQGNGTIRTALEITHLTLHALTLRELEAYLDTHEWQGCAGGYRIEGKGQWLMSCIDGDRTNVQGLPMLKVAHLLREAGFGL